MKRLAVLLLGLVILSACGQAAVGRASTSGTVPHAPPTGQTPPASRTLTPAKIVITIDTLVFTPLYVALQRGFFQQEGVQPTIVHIGGAAATAALTSGSVDFVAGNGSAVPLAWSKGATSVIAVGNIVQDAPTDTVIADAAMQRLGESPKLPLQERLSHLKGSTFAVLGAGSADDNLLSVYLRRAHLQRNKDVTVVDAGSGANELLLLEHGQVDLFTAAAPISTEAVAAGKATILIPSVDVPGTKNISWDALATSKALIQKDPKLVREVVHAIGMGINYTNDPANTASVIAIAERQFASVRPSLIANGVKFMLANHVWPANAGMSQQVWKNQIALDNAGGQAAGEVGLDTRDGGMWTSQFFSGLNGRE